jgi:predicted nucleotide-binding protein
VTKTKILFVDDEAYQSRLYIDAALDGGFDVQIAESVEEALELARSDSFDLILLDVMMPSGSFFDETETAGGFRTGKALARELSDIQPEAKIVAFTNSRDPEIEAWFTKDDTVAYIQKQAVQYDELSLTLRKVLRQGAYPPQSFIVHGHDRTTLLELKNFLQNRLGLPEPDILSEKPSHGLTLIEKFEKYAAEADLVFVLLTPDDLGGPVGSGNYSARPRQNVVFEFGYFLGSLRRHSGRVFLLKKGESEIPSDITGVVYVDITDGIDAAAEGLRRELEEWL